MPAYNVTSPRAIIDRKALTLAITTFAAENSAPEARKFVAARLDEALSVGDEAVRRRFENGASGAATVRARAYLIDQIIRVIFDYCDRVLYPTSGPTKGERLAVVAVGGFGRGELAPFSDIDIMLLRHYKPTPRGEQIVEAMLYILWDLGLKVGHSSRSVDECIRLSRRDVTIRTAILEARWIWGDRELYDELNRRFTSEVIRGTAREFVELKLAEREERHQRMGDSRYLLEPNLKDGKGGLRDLHTLAWIGKYVYEVDSVDALASRGVLTRAEVRVFEKAQEFFWMVRCHLHYLVGRADERLTYDVQPEIAARMGYTDHAGSSGVERFMKRYFLIAKDVGDLTRIFCANLEAEQQKPKLRLPRLWGRTADIAPFELDNGRLSVPDDSVFTDDPVNMLRLFHVALFEDLDIHPKALQMARRGLKRINAAVRKDEQANKLFLEILCADKQTGPILRLMNEAGVFGRFVPEFGRIVAQMQYNMYHVYTVDEHTIHALSILNDIDAGHLTDELPLASEVVHQVVSRRVLTVGVMMHDIAKGRPGDHSEVGAKLAQRLCPRLGLSEEETETVAWLVLHHLRMSDTAFKRDIGDPKTIEDFVALVRSPERLRLLLVLTVVDIRAVGPSVWNGWKASLLRELYHVTEEALTSGLNVDTASRRVEGKIEALRAALPDWDADALDTHIARGTTPYWLTYDVDTLAAHARMVRQAEADDLPLMVTSRIDEFRAVTEVTIYTQDQPGLFSRIAGALTVAGADVVDAKIFTLSNGWALDTFWIQDNLGSDGAPAAFARPERLAKLSSIIEQSLTGRIRANRVLTERAFKPKRNKVFKVAPRVLIDNKASATCTVVEVNGANRPGLLFSLTRALNQSNTVIKSAKISTFGELAVDVFYVQDLFGTKILHSGKQDALRARLYAALEAPGTGDAGGLPRERSAAEFAVAPPPAIDAAE